MIRANDYLVALMSLAVALGFGLSYGDAGSNHPTYVPPGLMLVDDTLLRNDWWATSVTHYHFAFNYLVALLETLGVLAWGLALGNILFIAAFLWILWRLVGKLAPAQGETGVLIWAVVVCFIALSDGVVSVGDSFLFSPSLQPSTIASTCTLAALYLLIERRLLLAGLILATGGLVHANFLVLNVLFFGAAYGLSQGWAWTKGSFSLARSALEAAKLLAPSVIAIAALLPFMIGVAASASPKDDAGLAEFIFFDFAVPFHYRPNTYLPVFWALAGWQLLGLLWTRAAVLDEVSRSLWWSLQISLGVLIWSATLLTTVVFVEPVARLFIWRLAPFAEVVGLLLFATGAMRSLRGDAPVVSWMMLLVSAGGLAAVARTIQYKFGVVSMQGIGAVMVPAILLASLALKRAAPAVASRASAVPGLVKATSTALGAVLVLLSLVLMFAPDRYNLVMTTPRQADETELYDWVREHTSLAARFVTPPDLHGFRLNARRAIIADLKALPFDRPQLVEWYHRLEAISGTDGPRSMADVIEGYSTLDESRLAVLRQQYGITHAVLRVGAPTGSFSEWKEVFRNGTFIVLEAKTNYAEATP
jgi:hypothetical protein